MDHKIEFYMLFNQLSNGAWQPVEFRFDYLGVYLFSEKHCEHMKTDCHYAICRFSVENAKDMPKLECTCESEYTLCYVDED